MKKMKIRLFVLTKCTNVTDTRTDRHTVAVLEFSLGGGALGWRHFHLGEHTTNTFVLNYRVCNHLCQIINT